MKPLDTPKSRLTGELALLRELTDAAAGRKISDALIGYAFRSHVLSYRKILNEIEYAESETEGFDPTNNLADANARIKELEELRDRLTQALRESSPSAEAQNCAKASADSPSDKKQRLTAMLVLLNAIVDSDSKQSRSANADMLARDIGALFVPSSVAAPEMDDHLRMLTHPYNACMYRLTCLKTARALCSAQSATLAPNVDGRDFYELCQQYRHSKEIMPHPSMPNTVQAFAALQEYIKTGKLPWFSYERHDDINCP